MRLVLPQILLSAIASGCAGVPATGLPSELPEYASLSRTVAAITSGGLHRQLLVSKNSNGSVAELLDEELETE